MNLIVDVGNSSVKLAVFQGDELLDKKVFKKSEIGKNLEEIFKSYPGIYRKIVSSVSGDSFVLPEIIYKDENLIKLDAFTRLPFKNKYATPETLGDDRKALVAAASKYYPNRNVLVIDAGTCLTFDFKNDRNEYLGGAISPGLTMRFRSLHTFTARLPLLEAGEEENLIGDSTRSSILSGVINGMAREIEGVVGDYTVHYHPLKIIFTGGDAQFLSKRLKNGIFANSNFLLEGLNYILEFNKSQ